ncbi:MAG: SUMF1/EgtB/PvdO family nonheme iron enzyme [Chitinivibrionales bacterium]|nr:SUMF1/EgtB/PvdO family nonheme iron enzyme [Chitinivibrionales bacterium]
MLFGPRLFTSLSLLVLFLIAVPEVASESSLLSKDTVSPENPPNGMVWIPGGVFTMGTIDADDEEGPYHEVKISGFFMDRTEVTQEQFKKKIFSNPSFNKTCPTCPAERVTWFEANAYCKKAGKRLPTEAEWEYAARGGLQTIYSWGAKHTQADSFAWYESNAAFTTHPVGKKKPNNYGLHDMNGNVWEWCADWYDARYYEKTPRENPPGPEEGTHRVIRGGSFENPDRALRPAARDRCKPDARRPGIGFRCMKGK